LAQVDSGAFKVSFGHSHSHIQCQLIRMGILGVAAYSSLTAGALAQQAGTQVQEQHPPMPLWTCTASGCVQELKSVTLDANWRWIHDKGYTSCYKDSSWNKALCPDPEACARNCQLEGVDSDQYESTYGVVSEDDGLKLEFVKKTEYGTNFGSRVYLMDDDDTYKLFKLKNREFTLTVDMARMPCGLNGAVYFVEMDKDGGGARSDGRNAAGAKYGTGYCDAQCPHDLKFVDGMSNTVRWNSTSTPPVGKYGVCCAEMDIWEANSRSTAYTPHPCSINGPSRCDGTDCGDNDSGDRYSGVCDKDGCDYNSYRMGDTQFYGRHGPFTLDSTQELTVVTQFITHDGTDSGDLVDIRRLYVQGGKVIQNSDSSIAGVRGNAITDDFCAEMKTAFGDINDFQRTGGLKSMGEALDRGMVLVMSLWDDSLANMLWLDSDYPPTADPSHPGVARGPCLATTGSPEYVRGKYPSASAKFSRVMVGTIGSTVANGHDISGDDEDEFGDNRRLNAGVHV